jgi:hypothetical protein
VNGIAARFGAGLRVFKLDVNTAAGRTASDRLGLDLVPATLVFDSTGVERYRSVGRMPRLDAVATALGDG